MPGSCESGIILLIGVCHTTIINMKRRKSPTETRQIGTTQKEREMKRYPKLTNLDFDTEGIRNNKHSGGGGGDTAKSSTQLTFNINQLDEDMQYSIKHLLKKSDDADNIVITSHKGTRREESERDAKDKLNEILEDAEKALRKKGDKENRNKKLGGKPKKIKEREKRQGKQAKYRKNKYNH